MRKLAYFHADIEGEQVGYQAIRRDVVFDDLRGQAESVEQAEDQRRRLGVGLEAEPSLECAEIVQGLVDHRQADNGVDQITVDAHIEIDTEQHRRGMAQRKQADVKADMLEPV